MTGQCYNVYRKPDGSYVHGNPVDFKPGDVVLRVMRAAVLRQFPAWRCIGTATARKPVMR